MNYYSTLAPMRFAIPADSDYQILDSTGTVVYSGRVAQMPNDTGTPEVDIAPIMRQLVPAPEYGAILQNIFDADSGHDNDPTPKMFSLKSEDATSATQFYVWWNYKNVIRQQIAPSDILGGGIQDYVYIDQPFLLSVIGRSVKVVDMTYSAGTSGNWVYDIVNDHTLTVYQNAQGTAVYRKYTVVDCLSDDFVILYYIDGDGGVAWVICEKKNTITQNISRSQISHESDYENSYKFGVDNYAVETYNAYTLNTGYLTNEQSQRLQYLFRSPKVWLWNKSGVWSVVLTDTQQTVKTKANSGQLFNYTIKCRESQTLEIYG